MELHVIKSDQQYEQYLDWVDGLFDKGIKPDSPQGKKVEVCLLLIKD